jgi:hypothetical protein
VSLAWPRSDGLTGPLSFSDALHGWVLAYGQGGPGDLFRQRVYYTRNGGRSWQLVPLSVQASAIAASAPGVAYVVGGGSDWILKVTAPNP